MARNVRPDWDDLGDDAKKILASLCRCVAEGYQAANPAGRVIFPGTPAVKWSVEEYAQEFLSAVRGGLLEVIHDEVTDRYGLIQTELGRRITLSAREMAAWVAGDMAPTRAHGSRLHDFREAAFANDLANVNSIDADALFPQGWDAIGVFVVEHDWAAAFADADLGQVDERRAPYPVTCFELMLGGKHVCAFVDDLARDYMVAVNTAQGWAMLDADIDLLSSVGLDATTVLRRVGEQVDAILVALDSGVATTEMVRAPGALNAARRKRRKLPLYDYHAVKLSRRARPAPLPQAGAPGDRVGPRLHFRRGHWRHLSTHKVWINWTLVGDPDLGFIDKHYRL